MHTPLITLCVGLATLASCASWPGLEDPTLTISPEYTLLKMSGKTRMQSGTPPMMGAYLNVGDLGAGDREDNLGVKVSYGDEASGFDLHYNRFEAHSAGSGFAADSWGNIPPPSGTPPVPEEVDTRVTMDDFRARYIASFKVYEREESEWIRLGAGLQLAHRDLSFDVRGITSGVAQKIKIQDAVSPMLAVRIAGRRGPIGLTIDVAYSPDWVIVASSDMDGDFYDLSIQASYFLEDQDLTVFGGYRRFDLPASGTEGGNRFETDFEFDGYVFGFKFVF